MSAPSRSQARRTPKYCWSTWDRHVRDHRRRHHAMAVSPTRVARTETPMNIHPMEVKRPLPDHRKLKKKRTMQMNRNNETEDRQNEFSPGRAEIFRLLEHRQQVPPSFGGNDFNRRRTLSQVLEVMSSLSYRLDLGVQIFGRIKSAASILNKMLNDGFGVHQVLDIIGVRAVI